MEQQTVPQTKAELLECVALETARMSYPGSMSRGTRPVVKGDTKASLEKYFVLRFPMATVWDSARGIKKHYESWHRERTREVSASIRSLVVPGRVPMAVAAKFLDTFMHQLMKYEPCRPLWPVLHLPLDRRVFSALSRMKLQSLSGLRCYLSASPYDLLYSAHAEIQARLWKVIAELNASAEFKLQSRVELNWLWL